MKEILKNFFYNLLVKGLGGKRLKSVPDNLNNLLEINQELDYEKSIIDQAFGAEEDDEDEAIKKALDSIIKKSKNICIMDGIYCLNAYIKDVLVIEVEGYDSPLLITDKAQIEEVNSRLERMARWYLAFLKEDLAKNN